MPNMLAVQRQKSNARKTEEGEAIAFIARAMEWPVS